MFAIDWIADFDLYFDCDCDFDFNFVYSIQNICLNHDYFPIILLF